MRFMLLMSPKPDALVEMDGDWTPTVEMVEVMMGYNAALQKAGVLLEAEGLRPPEMGARVTKVGGKITVTDGPFAEAKEVIAGRRAEPRGGARHGLRAGSRARTRRRARCDNARLLSPWRGSPARPV